jgi:hypothetical protein
VTAGGLRNQACSTRPTACGEPKNGEISAQFRLRWHAFQQVSTFQDHQILDRDPSQGPQARHLGRTHPDRARLGPDHRHGHISKQGSTWLRWILCEAAQTAKRSPQFAASYQAISRRRGKKIADTAIARKLLTRAYHLLTDADNAAAGQDAADAAWPNTGTRSRTAPHSQTGGSPHPGELAKSHEPAQPRSMT